MLTFEKNELQADVIPYKDFPERIRITKQEQKKKRRVTFDSENVYSFPYETKESKYIKTKTREFRDGKSSRVFKNFKCNSCSTVFRIVALTDIQWSICPMCGGANIDFLGNREERDFEKIIN